MKKAVITILTAFVTLMLASCSKGPAAGFCGIYSFKTGGYVEAVSESEEGQTVLYLAPKSGQMRILPDGKDKVKVTMNVIGGDPAVFDGTVEDGVLTLLPEEMRVTLYNDSGLLDHAGEAMLEVSGKGDLYDGTVIFKMEYSGEVVSLLKKLTIVSSNVNCIATRNE